MSKMFLGDVCLPESSNIAQKDLTDKDGQYPIYGASGLISHVNFYRQECEYIAVVKDGAGIGRVFLLPPYSSIIGTMQYILPNPNIDVHYLYFAMQFMNLAKYYSGSTIPHIYFKNYKHEPIKLPPLEKQREIAATLETIKQAEDNLNEQITRLDELVKSRFVEMFGDPVTNPMGWEIATIGEIATDVKYGTSAKASDTGKYKYLRMNNLTYDGGLDLSDLKYIDMSDDELEKYVVRKGDILFNRTNSTELVGKTALFDFGEDMVIAGYIIRVRLQEKISPVFFTRFMNLEQMKTQLRTMAKGAVNQANINAQEMKSIKVYLPPLALQNEFATFVEQTDKSKLVLRQLLEKQQTLKAALMQEYFS